MVNLVAAQKPIIKGLMKLAGVKPHSVEIEPGTVMNFWVPSKTLTKSKSNPKPDSEADTNKKKKKKIKPKKPAVVLLHGFAGEGIVTWHFQVGALSKKYSVYVPDLVFFGGSQSDRSERTPAFQAECVATGLKRLGVEQCVVVGFSYGGMVAFKMAELNPTMVTALVVSGSVHSMTGSVSETTLTRLGYQSSADLLLPTTVEGLKALLSVAAYKKIWFPDRIHRDYLQVMFTNRKERTELLEALVVSEKDPSVPNFPQRIHLLWGEKDEIFKQELAQSLMEQIGQNVTFEGIKKAGHLVHLERPFVYNKCLKKFLASLFNDGNPLQK